MIDFAITKNMSITSTLFQHKESTKKDGDHQMNIQLIR